jgi:YHS domain-containing protein
MQRIIAIAGLLLLCTGLPACRGERTAPAPSAPASKHRIGQTVTCPVCGLRFDAGEADFTATHDGRTYYFLLEDHRDAFAEAPGDYIRKHSSESREQPR